MPHEIPAHLPKRLTITLWDFTWYTQTMPGEPFESLDRAFEEAVERGYNTVRICAMPYFLFGGDGRDPGPLQFSNLGGEYGQRTRWYDCRGGAELDGREQLVKLFRAAERHDCYVILSSWEYQQSPSFLATPELHRELLGIPPKRRFGALAEAMGRLIQHLKDNGLADRIAYAELHNEVDLGKLTEVAATGGDAVSAEKPHIESALASLRFRHPDILTTACYARPTLYRMNDLAENMQVAHFHLYVYGVLGKLFEDVGLRRGYDGPFPTERARYMLRSGAPEFEEWRPSQGEEWRSQATVVRPEMFYMFDWADPDKWDLYLYENYHLYRESMRRSVQDSLEAFADFAQRAGVPAVIGEGYVGYTPLLANFEEGPVGKNISEYAVETCLRLGYWGYMLCSNCAPHHPFWQDLAWQQRMNSRIQDAD